MSAGGQAGNEGWYALPEVISYLDNAVTFPFTDTDGNQIINTTDWVTAFANGTLPQDKLDKVLGVMPLGNQDLAQLVGKKCVAVVYDSDISMNYDPIYANLQGDRLGSFAFTVLGAEVPGSIPESQPEMSVYDLWLRVEPPLEITYHFNVAIRNNAPDAIGITRARYQSGKLAVWGTSSFGSDALMTVSVDGADAGSDPGVTPFIFEAPMTYNSKRGRYEFEFSTNVNLDGRRVTISTDKGGAFSAYIE